MLKYLKHKEQKDHIFTKIAWHLYEESTNLRNFMVFAKRNINNLGQGHIEVETHYG